jgi:hypothetical protein
MSISLKELHAPGFLDPTWVGLARELSQDIREAEVILRDYGFNGPSDPAWLELAESPDFIECLKTAAREWNTADSTAKRIRVKAQASLEMALPELHAMAVNNASPSVKLDALRLIKSIAGFDHNGGMGSGAIAGDAQQGGFSITINVADKTTRVEVAARPPTIEGQAEDAG